MSSFVDDNRLIEEIRNIVSRQNEPKTIYLPGTPAEVLLPFDLFSPSFVVFWMEDEQPFGSIEDQAGIIMRHIGEESIIRKKWLSSKILNIGFIRDGSGCELVCYWGKELRDRLPAELEEGFDVYISKLRGSESPRYLSLMLSHLHCGGYVISFKSDLVRHCVIRDSGKVYEPYEISYADIGLKRIAVLQNGRYPVHIFEKVTEVPLVDLEKSLSKEYYRFLLETTEGLLCDFESSDSQLFRRPDIDWSPTVMDNASLLTELLKILPNDLAASYQSRVDTLLCKCEDYGFIKYQKPI